jgi:hypothetical protein
MQRTCCRLAVSTVYFIHKLKFTIKRKRSGNEMALDKFVSPSTQNTIRNFILNFLRLILITNFATLRLGWSSNRVATCSPDTTPA